MFDISAPMASLQVLADVAGRDPDAGARRMARQTLHILESVEEQYEAALA